MASETLSFRLRADNTHLNQGFRGATASVNRFAKNAKSKFKSIGTTLNNTAGKALNKFSGMIGAIGVGAVGNELINIDSRIGRLGIQAGKSSKDMLKLKREMFELGKESFQSPEALIGGIESIVDRTGDLDLAVKMMQGLGKASTATGADVKELGALATNLSTKMQIAPEKMQAALGILTEQGKAGEFQLKDLAGKAEQIFSAASKFTQSGEKGLVGVGATMQMIRGGVGSTDQAVTAFEALTRDLVGKRKKLKDQLGIDVIDHEATKRTGKETFRSIDVLMQEIVKKSEGRQTILGGIFGDESGRALSGAISAQNAGKLDELFNTYRNISKDGTSIQSDFEKATELTSVKMQRMKSIMLDFADVHLAKPLEMFGQALDYIGKHQEGFNTGLKVTAGLLAGLAAIKVGSKMFSMFKNVKSFFGKGSKGGASGTMGAMGSAQPVFITNWNDQGASGQVSDLLGRRAGQAGAAGSAAASSKGMFSKMFTGLRRRFPILRRLGRFFGRIGGSLAKMFPTFLKWGLSLGGVFAKLGGALATAATSTAAVTGAALAFAAALGVGIGLALRKVGEYFPRFNDGLDQFITIPLMRIFESFTFGDTSKNMKQKADDLQNEIDIRGVKRRLAAEQEKHRAARAENGTLNENKVNVNVNIDKDGNVVTTTDGSSQKPSVKVKTKRGER